MVSSLNSLKISKSRSSEQDFITLLYHSSSYSTPMRMFSLMVPDIIHGSSAANAMSPFFSIDPSTIKSSLSIPISKAVFPDPTDPITIISSPCSRLKLISFNVQFLRFSIRPEFSLGFSNSFSGFFQLKVQFTTCKECSKQVT